MNDKKDLLKDLKNNVKDVNFTNSILTSKLVNKTQELKDHNMHFFRVTTALELQAGKLK
jgi:hypothetical protein